MSIYEVNDLSFAIRQSIGVFYIDRQWALNLFDKIIKLYPKEFIKRIRKSDVTLGIILMDGTTINFVRACEASRGLCFSKVIMQNGINQEMIKSVILPTFKHMNKQPMIFNSMLL